MVNHARLTKLIVGLWWPLHELNAM
jgi:hypothetical protein